jgi:hypothetical protein
MPSDLQALEAGPVRHFQWLSFLKGKDNPFDVFVAARHADAEFSRYHVPAVHSEVLGDLVAVIERYRPARLQWESDLPRSGVVVVLGSRGSGKTHMVHALGRSMDPPRVLVTPSIFEPHRPFIEYLLQQLVRHFQKECEDRSRGTLDLLADALARQVIVQALHGLTEVDWLCRNVKGRWRLTNPQFLTSFLGLGTHRLVDRKRLLILDLEQRDIPTILEVCRQHEQDPTELRRIALQHVHEAEPGHTIAGQIRRGLYTHLVGLAFGEPREEVYDFLLDGYTQVEARAQPARETLVDELFQALVELCLLARMPVVYAFDALETLLSDPPDPKLWQSFSRGLADVLDSHRGIPFLIFAEHGNWQQGQSAISPYAQQRFQQGVIRVPGRGSLSTLALPPVSVAGLRQIVAARLRPLRVEFFGEDQGETPDIVPFQDGDLKKTSRTQEGDEPPLRQALQALRDRFEELVNGRSAGLVAPAMSVSSTTDSALIMEQLEQTWKQQQRAANANVSRNGYNGLANDLHAGLRQWLDFLIAEDAGTSAGKPTAAANKIVGGHPTYGQATRYTWREGERSRDMALGFLLAGGAGMPRDLEAKLALAAATRDPVDLLVILWPKGPDLPEPVHESLPRGSRDVWTQYEKRGVTCKVLLRCVAADSLICWLALPPWLAQSHNTVAQVTSDVLRHFVAEQTISLLPLLAPRS